MRHSSTNEILYFLKHGRDPNMPIDVELLSGKQGNLEQRKEMVKRMQGLWTEAKSHSKWEAKQRNRLLE